MSFLNIQGYLQQPYLTTPYLASTAQAGFSSQVQRQIAAAPATHMQVADDIVNFPDGIHSQVKAQIVNALDPVHSQAQLVINATDAVHSQVQRVINAVSAYHMQVADDIVAFPDVVHSQVSRTINAISAYHMQVADDIVAFPGAQHSQINAQIASALAAHMQVADDIVAVNLTLHSQVNLLVVSTKVTHSQVQRQIVNALKATHMQAGPWSAFVHEICGEYLIKPYLATPYLGPDICAMGPMQVNRQTSVATPYHMQVADDIVDFPDGIHSQVQRIINFNQPYHNQVQRQIVNFKDATNAQVQRVINAFKHISSQVARTINFVQPYHMQTQLVFATKIHAQTTLVLYNTTNLRVLDKFPSRGTTGTNWVASSTATGDYGVNNVNNDIVEFAWRSNTGDITAVSLTCDTQVPQGVFVDTVGILGHNLTLSATVVMQGTNDPTFSTIGEEVTLDTTLNNMYYIAPTLPSAGFRYWRFLIDDPTNLATFLQIGTIVFGASIIFIGEDIVDQIKFSRKHFKDLIPTEGYTNVSNDRAMRRTLGLTFKDLDFEKANYESLNALFDFARTSLKCLWIPTPQYPTRFALFGKLTQLPEETHNDKGKDLNYIDLAVEIDESL